MTEIRVANPHGNWRHAFLVGDFVLITVVGAGTAALVSGAHALLHGFWAAALIGMVAGMAASASLAFVVRPLLGSIETTVPVMLGGMASGMAVCLGMFVTHMDTATAAVTGLVVGVIVHVYLRRVEARLRRAAAHRSGA